jgi:hypothetical protein
MDSSFFLGTPCILRMGLGHDELAGSAMTEYLSAIKCLINEISYTIFLLCALFK